MAKKSKTYFVKTFGCQMNEADSEKLAGALECRGFSLAKTINQADMVIINTCSVRESAENRVFGLVQNLIKSQTGQKLILTGCMIGSARGERRRYSLVELKRRLPRVDEFKTIGELTGTGKLEPLRKKKAHAFVPIMEGCDHFCTYCVVPYARGKEVSRPFEEIVCEIKELAKRGHREITLLGQNVNSYGKDLKPPRKFSDLLKELHKIDGIKKISFLTSNPWDFNDELIEAIAWSKIDKVIHLPVQSGDDEVLRRMNRGYTARRYLKLVKKIKRMVPKVNFTTDIIVGFPGETKKAFENTVKLCKKVGFEKAYIARYSPRPGTAAFDLRDNVPPKEKRERWRILEKLINKKT